ncbi:hypothetical protein [Brevundimonas vesicularis]|uniref:hypothetical protein n=1 Tax=Brevundimonas vesicularis TaxID=41276 RepID=UPI00384C2AA9
MPENVGGIIASAHARNLDCLICGQSCEPEIICRETRNADHFEWLRCAQDGETFRRVWIGGYVR